MFVKLSNITSICATRIIRNRFYFLNRVRIKRCSSVAEVLKEEDIISDIKSCLYIPNDKACKFVSVLKPQLNYEKIFSDVENNLKHRKMTVDVKQLVNGFKELMKIQNERTEIQKERQRLKECLRKHKDEQLDRNLAMLTKEWNESHTKLCQLENEIIIPILSLPNELHPKTPKEEDEIQFNFLSIPQFDFKVKSHKELGNSNKEIIFSDVSPTSYFLCKNAALFELNSLNYFSRVHESSNFTQTSNSDLCKPPLVEGCGYGFLDKNKSFVLDTDEVGSGYHLVGGASLESFYGYLMRRFVDKKNLPLRFFSVGRHYDVKFNQNMGLFKCIQSSRVNFFIATENENSKTDDEYLKIVELLINEYKQFGIHFRVVNLCAPKLNFTQSLRSSFQMWSPSLDDYVEVGHVSICGDFISRRLMAQYQEKKKKAINTMHLNVIHGVSLNSARLLACVMENTQDSTGRWTMPKNFCYF